MSEQNPNEQASTTNDGQTFRSTERRVSLSATQNPHNAADAETEPHARVDRTKVNQRIFGWMFALIGAIILFIVLMALWGAGLLRLPGSAGAVPTREPILMSEIDGNQSVLGSSLEGAPQPNVPQVPVELAAPASVSSNFQTFYDTRGGLQILGLPISNPEVINGREIQWFERARLEHWPEYSGTPYEIQLGRLGVEYTAGRLFPTQTFFVSNSDLRFFPETSHAVGGVFLPYWQLHGGLDVFGYPISEAFDETLPDGQTYRVQYFERARLEYHSDLAGTPYEVQVGLLGSALYRNAERPNTIQPAPTTVPLP